MDYNKLIKVAQNKGIEEIEVRVQKKASKEVTLFNDKVEKYEVSKVEKVMIRGAYQNKLAKINTENLNNSDIDNIVDLLIQNCQSITSNEPYVIYEGSKKYHRVAKKPFDFTAINMEDKLNDLHLLHKNISSKDKRICNISLTYSENDETIQLFNSKGLKLKKAYAYGIFVAEVMIEDQGDTRSEFKYQIKNDYNNFDLVKMADELCERLITKLHPVQVESKNYPIVLENAVSASLLSAFTSMFTGLAAIRNMTLLKDKIGQQIVGKNITIVDDPFDTNGIFTHSFDDQGVACTKRNVVDKGVLKTLLHDLKTAQMLNCEPTGHGFSGAITPTNMSIVPGNTSFNEMISSIEDGIFVTDLDGLHAGLNPVSGDFSAQASGYRIEKGKITYPISLVVVSGNYLDVLNNIEIIGNDLEYGFNSIGSPSLKIKSMSVSGK